MPGGNDADADQRQVEGVDPAGSDAWDKAVWRVAEVHWHRDAEGVDLPAETDGGKRFGDPHRVSRSAAQGRVYADGLGPQSGPCFGCYAELG